MTVGMVGLGNVGTVVARLLNAIGARVIAHDPGIDPAKAADREPFRGAGRNAPPHESPKNGLGLP